MRILKSTQQEQDQLILDTFKESPEKGLRMLFDVYYSKLCIYAVQLTDSFYMAEDVVQNVFVYFWEKKYYETVHKNLRHYLFYSVRNAALGALQKEHLLSMEELSGIDMGIQMEPEDEQEWEEREQVLKQKLKTLSPQERQVVQFVIMENKKYKEAAEELNISVNTLKTYLARALKQLRKEYNLMLLFY